MFELRAAAHVSDSGRASEIKKPAHLPSPLGLEQDIHILDRLGVVFRYRHAAITVFLLAVIGVLVDTYSTIPMFKTQARLLIDDERSTAVPGLTNQENTYYQDPEPYYQTQYRILQGRELARKVVQKLQLDQVPEFNGKGPQPTKVGAAVESLKRSVTSLWSWSSPRVVADATPGVVDEGSLIGTFLSRIDVQPVRNSRLVDVAFQSANPELAARAANTLAEEYVQQNLDFRVQSVQQTLIWLTEEIAKQQKKVEDSERALGEYRERQNAPSLDDRQNIVGSRLSQLNDAVTRAKTVRVQKEAIYNQVKQAEANGAGADTISVIVQSASIQNLKNRLAELQRDKVRLSEKYGDKHPDIQKVNASLQDAQRQLAVETSKATEAVKNEFQAALAEERVLARALEEQKGAAMDLSRKSVSYTVLQREAQSNRQVYESLLQREKELRVVRNSRSNNVRLMDRAEVPGAPFTPNTRRVWPIAFGLGLTLALATSFLLDYLNDTIKTPEDIKRKLNMRALGVVPAVRGQKSPLLAGLVPNEFREAFNELRTSLVFSHGQTTAKIVAVTSAQPLEGKTTTAGNLGFALAALGARVLIMDADMRRPNLHNVLGIANDRGLSELLVGQVRASDAIRPTTNANLFVMTAGRIPPNPSELLASERMRLFIEKLATTDGFEWVVVDTPPVLAVTDAVILAPMMSCVMLVIGAEMTRRRLAQRSLETILASKPRVVGAVLNRVDFTRNWFYYSRYYGSQHRGYYVKVPANG